MTEHHITVPRTARYYTTGDPDAAEVWFVCHGYAQLARYFLRWFEAIDDGSRLIVAPEALNRYYFEDAPGVHGPNARVAATWMTREDREHEIADQITYLDALYESVVSDVARSTIVALGFSQGTAPVSRWAARGRARIDHVVLWAGRLAVELAPRHALFRGADLMIAVGDDDANIPRLQVIEEERRLRDGGLEYRLHEYRGGHRIEPEALRDVARLLQHGRAG